MISRLPGGRQVRNLDYEMKTMKLIILMILISANLCSQNIKFSKSKIIFAYTPTTPELADTLTIYNVDGIELEIDSIYSVNYYGYRLNVFFKDTSFYYGVFSGQELTRFYIAPYDSAIFIFSNPDLCPICKELHKVNAFTDSILFYSNSKDNNYSYLEVEGLGYVLVDESEITVGNYFLSQNYPNPFNPITKIKYLIPKSGTIQIKVYNILGSEIKILVNEYKQAGAYEIEFDASALGGLPSGVYFYSLRVNDFVQNKKMTLLK